MSGRCTEKAVYAYGTMLPCNLPAGFGPGGAYCRKHGPQKNPPTETWFAAGHGRVKSVPVIEVRGKSLLLPTGTVRIEATHEVYFRTREEAAAWCIERARADVERQEAMLDYARKELLRTTKEMKRFVETEGDKSW